MSFHFSRRQFVSMSTLSLVSGLAKADTPPLAARFDDLYRAASKEREVVYYSNARPEEARGLSVFWKTNFPNVRLTILSRNAPEIITQIEAERSAGQVRADVVTTSQPYIAVQWRQQGMFEPYKVSSVNQLGSFAEPDGSYCVT